jgi:hypothetical protein
MDSYRTIILEFSRDIELILWIFMIDLAIVYKLMNFLTQ